jgi:four helix bundle protein
MDKFRFLEWKVYKDSQELFKLVLKIVRKLPREYRFEVGSQIVRASLSVILNIAEGSGKNSDRELNRFFDISLGSLYEVLASVDTLLYNGFINKDEFNEVSEKVKNISDQLGGFKKKLKK